MNTDPKDQAEIKVEVQPLNSLGLKLGLATLTGSMANVYESFTY